MILEAVGSAKENGAVTVGITGTGNSALSLLTDYTFVTPEVWGKSQWVASRTAQMMFNDMLFEALLTSDEERFQSNLKRSGEELEGDVLNEAKERNI